MSLPASASTALRPAPPLVAFASRRRRSVSSRASSSSSSAPPPSPLPASTSVTTLARELEDLVTRPPSAPRADARVLELVAALESARAPVDPAAFAGTFQVAWSSGTMAWRAIVARAVQAVSGRSRAGQRFDLDARPPTARNFAQLLGGAVEITAGGYFRPADVYADPNDPDAVAADAVYPVRFDVQIAGGAVTVAGRRWDLPICGPGEFEVLYGDERVRVFRSSGGVAVQVPSDWTPSSDEDA